MSRLLTSPVCRHCGAPLPGSSPWCGADCRRKDQKLQHKHHYRILCTHHPDNSFTLSRVNLPGTTYDITASYSACGDLIEATIVSNRQSVKNPRHLKILQAYASRYIKSSPAPKLFD